MAQIPADVDTGYGCHICTEPLLMRCVRPAENVWKLVCGCTDAQGNLPTEKSAAEVCQWPECIEECGGSPWTPCTKNRVKPPAVTEGT